MRKVAGSLFFLLCAGGVMMLSIGGPEMVARYRDKAMLEAVHTMPAGADSEGYRYTLSPGEKLHILSESLKSQVLPESEQYAATRKGLSAQGEQGYEDLTGTYAFVVNHRGPSGAEITDNQIYETCNRGLDTLKEQGILPDTVQSVDDGAYSAVMYSAIDVLEPRNSVVVWKLELSSLQKNADKRNRLIDAYIDADDGRIYEFYARTSLVWDEIDPDQVVKRWGEYMGLDTPVPYEMDNPLMEPTPYFKKYIFSGAGEEKTIVTVGFYEGINELFLKISK